MADPDLKSLTDLVRRLRAPDGCPWDREQQLADVRAYLLEEAHEVAATIDTEDVEAIAAELGDLLFQTVFTAVLVEEGGGPDLDAIADAVCKKMVERHPHVFGEEHHDTVEEVNRAWETRKARQTPKGASVLDGLPESLPALLNAYRMTQKAAGVGFDWPSTEGVWEKIDEEIEELRQASEQPDGDRSRIAEELGDLLLAIANLSRHFGVDPEGALARANGKFGRRFRFVERGLELEGRRREDADLEEMQRLWQQAKSEEKDSGET